MNTESNFRSEKKSNGKGCLIGCLVAAIGIPVLLIIGGYFMVMHSSVPLRLVANIINADDKVEIKGIGGSISSGFTIEELRASDEEGNESVLEGLSLKWQDMSKLKTSGELIIEEIALQRAHIYIDTSEQEGEADAATDAGGGSASTQPDAGSFPIELFEIKKVDIREVVIESTTGEFKFELDEILMEGFRVQGDDFELHSLTVGSNYLDMDLEDAEPATIDGQYAPFTRRLVGTLKPNIHESLNREINFTVDMGALGGKFINRIQFLDGAVEVINLGENGRQSMQLKNFSPSEYFSEDWQGLISDINLLIKSEAPDPNTGLRTVKAESGTFVIGNTTFVVEPRILLEGGPEAPEGDATPPIVATGKKDDLSITAKLEKLDAPPFFRVSLSSTPEREPNELLALLLFDKPFADLGPAQRAKVDSAVKKPLSGTD